MESKAATVNDIFSRIRFVIALVLLGTAVSLAGCGVKGDPEAPPDRVQEPESDGSEDNDPWWKVF